MSKPKPIRCLVDDTALTRNIAEIETWVSQGTIILIVPLYSRATLVIRSDTLLMEILFSPWATPRPEEGLFPNWNERAQGC